jgi:hypothetical protein
LLVILKFQNLKYCFSGGKKGGLFYDVQNLSRIWNHPCILAKAKEREDNKRMVDDDEEEIDEAGSLKDFVVDE